MFLSPNEQVSVANLLYGIVTLSGNDACVVLAEHIAGTEQNFVERMNRTAKQIGLANSHFGTSNGWPDGGVTYVTARDLADGRARSRTSPSSTSNSIRAVTSPQDDGRQRHHLCEPRSAAGSRGGADGLKTGHTEEAGYGFTGSAEQNGRRLVMVMAGLTSSNARAEESVKFMNWGFRARQAKPVVAQGKKVADAEVQMGSSSSVGPSPRAS